MPKWESIETEHTESVFRLPVLGGWLVKIVQELAMTDMPDATIDQSFGHQWTSSVAFVPDPEHKWDLSEDYG